MPAYSRCRSMRGRGDYTLCGSDLTAGSLPLTEQCLWTSPLTLSSQQVGWILWSSAYAGITASINPVNRSFFFIISTYACTYAIDKYAVGSVTT
jgi:hypothetical protein